MTISSHVIIQAYLSYADISNLINAESLEWSIKELTGTIVPFDNITFTDVTATKLAANELKNGLLLSAVITVLGYKKKQIQFQSRVELSSEIKFSFNPQLRCHILALDMNWLDRPKFKVAGVGIPVGGVLDWISNRRSDNIIEEIEEALNTRLDLNQLAGQYLTLPIEQIQHKYIQAESIRIKRIMYEENGIQVGIEVNYQLVDQMP